MISTQVLPFDFLSLSSLFSLLSSISYNIFAFSHHSSSDPQIHTLNVLQQKGHTGFGGRGNLGIQGFEKFLRSHRCNAICRYLRLPPVNAKVDDHGTLPNAPVMQYGHVEIVNVHISSSGNGNSPVGQAETTPLVTPKRPVANSAKRSDGNPEVEEVLCLPHSFFPFFFLSFSLSLFRIDSVFARYYRREERRRERKLFIQNIFNLIFDKYHVYSGIISRMVHSSGSFK